MLSHCPICNHRNLLSNPWINRVLCSGCGVLYKLPIFKTKNKHPKINHDLENLENIIYEEEKDENNIH